MRIAVWHNLPSGGGQRALYDHVRGLIARGHEVEIWSPPDSDRSLLNLAELAQYHTVALEQPGSKLLNRVPYAADQLLGFYIRAMDRHCKEVAAEIHRGRFDILLCGTCRQFGAPRIGRFVKLPSVLYLQEPHRRLYEAPNVWALRHRATSIVDVLRSGIDIFVVQRLRQQVREEIDNAASFDRLLVNSQFSAEAVGRAYGLPSRVCYLGVQHELWQVQSRNTDRRVLGVGTVAPHKRVHFILAAIAATAFPHPKLEWIGNSWSETYLREVSDQAKKLEVDLNFHLAISHDEMLRIIEDCSLLAYAPRLEPFGYVPLECAAAGLATVAVAEGGIRETVRHGETGILVQDDVHEMATAIDELMSSPRRSNELGAMGRQVVRKRWAIEDAINRIERELEQVKSFS